MEEFNTLYGNIDQKSALEIVNQKKLNYYMKKNMKNYKKISSFILQ